jgi:hypothetical protein
LETKLKIIVDFEAGKRAVNMGCETGIPPAVLRKIVGGKQRYIYIYIYIAKLNIFLKFNSVHTVYIKYVYTRVSQMKTVKIFLNLIY